MKNQRSIRRIAAVGALGLAVLTSCSDDTTDSSADTTETTEAAPDTTSSPSTTTMPADTADGPSGPACSAVPADGAGSFDGMAEDPAATAASNNPVLSTLVSAVQAAGLVDTLNGPGPFTIFAPANDAFAKIPAADLDAVLADQELLTQILTLHVVPGEMSASELASAGSVTTVEGSDVTISGDADNLKVGDASVICANVEVANATVHIIDTVLMP